MKVISVMKVRKSLGQILDEVNLRSETFILERSGKAIAKLGPLTPEDQPDVGSLRIKALQDLKSLNMETGRSRDIDEWLDKERNGWDK